MARTEKTRYGELELLRIESRQGGGGEGEGEEEEEQRVKEENGKEMGQKRTGEGSVSCNSKPSNGGPLLLLLLPQIIRHDFPNEMKSNQMTHTY